MSQNYYYRHGQKIPVVILEAVRVVPAEGERSALAVQGWTTRPLTDRHVLLIRSDVAVSAERNVTAGNTHALVQSIVDKERAAALGERTANMIMNSQATPIERPDLRVFPVATHMDKGGALFCSGEIAAQFPAGFDHRRVEQIATNLKLFIARRLEFLHDGYVFGISDSDDPFECAKRLVEREQAVWAHPVFLENIPDRAVAAISVVDNLIEPALFSKQWYLENKGNQGGVAGVDIAARGAWSFTRGSADIVACVIDSGINIQHEVFGASGKLVPGYDFQDNDADPSPTTSSHGTSCAALIAADPVRGQVSGVASGCRLMPIRRPNVTNYLSLAESFGWAADHGADVLSCSFGLDGQPWVLPDVARAALDYAANHGRNGKGCPIFWAAGNGSESVSTDEWASSEFTIAIAASTDQGQRAPYSDFGSEISVCAPSSGGMSGVVTAKNSGYTYEFGGTSAAAPIAAGIACLILSLAPNMRAAEVQELLEKTARRIDLQKGAYDRNGFSPYYGHGQVDALAALLAIPALLEVERSTGIQGQDAGIRRIIAYLDGNVAGQIILTYLSARRLDFLAAIQSSKTLREATGRILRVVASLGYALNTGADVRIPDEIWPDVSLVLNQIKTMKPAPAGNS